MKYRYEITRGCTFCGTCEEMCPEGAAVLGKDGAVIHQEKCVQCGICYDNCAVEAIERTPIEQGEDS